MSRQPSNGKRHKQGRSGFKHSTWRFDHNSYMAQRLADVLINATNASVHLHMQPATVLYLLEVLEQAAQYLEPDSPEYKAIQDVVNQLEDRVKIDLLGTTVLRWFLARMIPGTQDGEEQVPE